VEFDAMVHGENRLVVAGLIVPAVVVEHTAKVAEMDQSY
jgi:hypothetical protein